jgi:hypothetical protein
VSLHPDTQACNIPPTCRQATRQLENICRWLTDASAGGAGGDLPTELPDPITSTAEPGQPP